MDSPSPSPGETAIVTTSSSASVRSFGASRSSLFWRPISRPHYRVRTVGRTNIPYTPEEIDFLVAYIFPRDTWYVFPASVFEKSKALYLRPGSKRSPLEQYREAWNLMGPVTVESAPSKAQQLLHRPLKTPPTLGREKSHEKGCATTPFIPQSVSARAWGGGVWWVGIDNAPYSRIRAGRLTGALKPPCTLRASLLP